MKKIFLTLLVLTMTLVLTACGGKSYEGLWNYKMNSQDYSVELKGDKTWVMKQGTAERTGPYTVEEKDGYTLITLDYKGSKGYMKWEDGKMCAYDDGKCSFYFERGEGTLGNITGK